MRKSGVYVAFLDLENTYDKVNTETLWQVPRTNDVGGKRFNEIRSMYVNILVNILSMMKEMKVGMERMGVRFLRRG